MRLLFKLTVLAAWMATLSVMAVIQFSNRTRKETP